MSSKQVTLKTLAIHSISALSAKVLGNRFMSCGAFTIEAKGMQTKPTRFGQNNESVNCDLKLWNNIPILYFHMAQPFVSYQVFFSSVLHGSPVFFRHPPPKMARCRGLWASDPCTLSADHSTWHTSQINAKQLSQGTGNIRKSISMPCADVEELHSSGYERVLWRKLCLLHCFNHIYIYIYDPKPGSDTSPCEKPPKRLDGFGMEHLNLHILANFWWLSTQVSCETTLFSVRSAVLVGKWDFLKEDKPCTHTSFPANQPWKSFGTVFAGLRFLPVQKFGPEWPWVWEWWTSTQPWRGETSETSSLKSPQQTCSEKRGCGARGGDPFFRILQQPLWGGWSVLHARHLLNWADGKFQGHSWGLHRKWQENEDFLEDFYFDVLFCFWGSKSHFFLKSFWEVPPKKRCPFDPLDA